MGRPLSFLASAFLVVFTACEPCAGTASCHVQPELNYSGQVIEHNTGATMGGVEIVFVRKSGPLLTSDTVRVVSRDDGFFELRAAAFSDGTVVGDLTVRSPPPHSPYTVPRVELKTSRVRGDGGILGRIVVDPFMLMVGELRERKTLAGIVGATVTMRRMSGALFSPDTVVFVTDQDARFFLQPTILDFGDGTFTAEFELDVPGHERKWLVHQTHKLQYTDDGIRFIFLLAGRTLNYVAQVVRRGTWQAMPGVTVEFTRTGGIPVQPPNFSPPVDPGAGGFQLNPEPLADGEVEFDLTIRPPAPYPTEILRGLRIRSHDDDSTRHMGFIGFGAQAYLRARFVDRATGAPADSGIITVVRRVQGLTIVTPLAADSGFRAIDSVGMVNYTGATPDSGAITFDVQVRLPPPANPEMFRGLQIQARYDSIANDVGLFRVGLWIPSTALLLDDATGAPIAGALVEYRRTSGIAMTPTFATQSQSDGGVRLAPIPLQAGEAVGDLFISAGGTYRDTTFAGVRLRTTQDDTLRSVGIFRLRRTP